MRRYPLVIAGTVVGSAAVLGYPVHHSALKLSAGSASSVGTVGGQASSPTTAPVAAPPSTTAPASTGSAPAGSAATTSPSTTTPSSPTRTATGTDEQFRYGDIAVKVTVSGSKVTNVGIAQISETDGRSQMIDQYAVPQLEQQVIQAGSANISGVSGATYTSQAFYDSLVSALQKLGVSS